MKILFKGVNSSDGIFLRCNCCRCEWMVQDRDDLRIEYFFDSMQQKDVPYYIAPCPCCNNEIHLGCDPKDMSEGFYSSWDIVFKRDDWNTNFAAEVKDVEQRGK